MRNGITTYNYFIGFIDSRKKKISKNVNYDHLLNIS